MDHKDDLSFGAICIKLGFSSTEKIAECLMIQRRMQELGLQPKRVGEIMVEKGYLSNDQVARIFWTQGIKGGHTEIGGYRILAKLGQGAMGNVYKAQQVKMDRIVALKVLGPKYAENPQFVKRFFQEARAVAKFNHPNIIQGIDCGESNGVHFFVMEYVDGLGVGQVIRQEGRIPEKRTIEIVLQVARGLEQANKVGLIHRDIKPDNIMLTKDGVAKLCDMGLAKDLTLAPGKSASEVGLTLGTPNYIAPEQALGDSNIDTRADIYSLGATIYHMVTGQVPFPTGNAMQVIRQHINEDPVPPAEINSELSVDINYVTMKMMSKEREERYQTPTELIADLDLLAAGKHLPLFDEPERPSPGGRRMNRINRLGIRRRFRR